MLTSFMQVLTREIGHVRNQVEADKPPDPLAAGRDPYLASDDMDDDGEGAQTAKRKRLFGDGRDPAVAWGPRVSTEGPYDRRGDAAGGPMGWAVVMDK